MALDTLRCAEILSFMGSHIITEREMPSDIVPVVCLKNMNLMGSFITAFAKITPTRYSKLSEIFITYV